MTQAKAWLREGAYRAGAYGLWHRLRNRHTLTVFMFHRVLPADSEAMKRADREFTFSVDGFERALDFIRQHYNVVNHDAVRAAIRDGQRLPPRAGLVTFDDGWRDTLLHARAPLARRGMSAVLFLSTEVPQLPAERWWQDQLVAMQSDPEALRQLSARLGLDGVPVDGRTLTVRLAGMPDVRRHEVLDDLVAPGSLGRQMLNADELSALAPVISIAGHGHTHAPLKQHAHPEQELQASHQCLQAWGADHWAMSFPHGEYDERCLALAAQAGFQVCHTSDAVLMDARQLRGKLGRIHIPENQWTCEAGRISHAKLAAFLFTRPVAS